MDASSESCLATPTERAKSDALGVLSSCSSSSSKQERRELPSELSEDKDGLAVRSELDSRRPRLSGGGV